MVLISKAGVLEVLSSFDDLFSKFSIICCLLGPKRTEDKSKRSYSIREDFFGEDFCYSLDAKKKGNIGRYLNHSCEPNCFVQNVFVDTHDLRFPWVSLFAKKSVIKYILEVLLTFISISEIFWPMKSCPGITTMRSDV